METLYAIVPRINKIRPEAVKFRIFGIIASKGKFLVIISFIASTSFVNGSASLNIRAAFGIMSTGKNAPMKNWSGTLITTAIELAASSFFAIEEIINSIPIAESEPKDKGEKIF